MLSAALFIKSNCHLLLKLLDHLHKLIACLGFANLEVDQLLLSL